MKNILKQINYKILLLFLGVLILTITGLLLFISNSEPKPINEEGLIETPKTPKSEWLRESTTENTDEFKIITNTYDGYRIKVPKEWRTEEKIDPVVGLVAYKTFSTSTYGDINDKIELRVISFDNKAGSLLNWIANSQESEDFFGKDIDFDTFEHPKKNSFKTSNKVYADHVHGEDPEPGITNGKYEKSLVNYYVLGDSDSVFVISCVAIGEQYIDYANQCEEIVKTFDIL